MKIEKSESVSLSVVSDSLELRESIPRQVDKKSGVPKEEIGVWSSQGGEKGKCFFSLSPELMITKQTAQFKLCTKDDITAMYPA